MRKLLLAALCVVGFSGIASALECCPDPCKPVRMKTILVDKMVEVQVPVQRWITVDKEVECTEYVEVQKEVQTKGTKVVESTEEYQCFDLVTKMVEQPYTKKVKQKVCEVVCVPVKKKVVEFVPNPCTDPCDPCPKKPIKLTKEVVEMVEKTVTKVVWVDVECVRMVKCVEKVPVTRTRTIKTVVPTVETKTITVKEPIKVMKTVQARECITEMQTVEKCVKVKVQVPTCEAPGFFGRLFGR